MYYFMLFLFLFKSILAFTPNIYIYSDAYTKLSTNKILKTYINNSNIQNEILYFDHAQSIDLRSVYSESRRGSPTDTFYTEKAIYFYPTFSGCAGCTTNIVRGGLIQQPVKQSILFKFYFIFSFNNIFPKWI